MRHPVLFARNCLRGIQKKKCSISFIYYSAYFVILSDILHLSDLNTTACTKLWANFASLVIQQSIFSSWGCVTWTENSKFLHFPKIDFDDICFLNFSITLSEIIFLSCLFSYVSADLSVVRINATSGTKTLQTSPRQRYINLTILTNKAVTSRKLQRFYEVGITSSFEKALSFDEYGRPTGQQSMILWLMNEFNKSRNQIHLSRSNLGQFWKMFLEQENVFTEPIFYQNQPSSFSAFIIVREMASSQLITQTNYTSPSVYKDYKTYFV